MAGTSTSPVADGHDGSSTVSTANLFGMFLTLSFCLLSQPYGSLFYVKPEGPLGRAVFFFHRLNPLACAVESILIVCAFCEITLRAIHERRQIWMASPNPPLTSRLVLGAKAILLLRKHTRVPDRWRAFATQQDAISMTPVFTMSSGISMSPGTYSEDQIQDQEAITRNAGPSDNIRSTEDDFFDVPLSEPLPLWMGTRTSRAWNGFWLSRPMRSHTAAAGPVAMHTATLEDAEIGIYDIEPVLDLRALRKSLSKGSGAGEYLISIVTFVGSMFVIFKTVSVIIPWWTKATIWCMLSGWISLQALLIVSQRGYDINSDTASILRTAIAVETKITGPVARVSTIFLTLPLLGYLSVVTSWQTVEMPDGTFDWVLGFFCSFPYVLGFLGLFSHDSKIRAFISLAWIPLLVDELQENCFTILITLMSASLGGTLAGLGIWRLYLLYHACKELVESSDVQSATSDSLDTSSAAAFCIYHVIFALLIFPFYTLWFFVPMKHPGTEPSIPRVPILVYNLAATLLMFVCTMLQYNPDGTYKPEWLDWLGRTLKTGQVSAGL